MTDQVTLQSLSDLLAALQRQVNDLAVLQSGQATQIDDNTGDIDDLKAPPSAVPPGLIKWYGDGHTTTEVDPPLFTSISDLNVSVATNASDISTIGAGLTTETGQRTSGDLGLQTSLDGLQAQVTTNLGKLTQETSDRSQLATSMSTQFTTTNQRIDDVQAQVSTQATDHNTAINSSYSQISTLNASVQTMQTQILLLQGTGVDPLGAQASQITTLTTLANDASAATAAETTNRMNADTAMQNSINTLSTTISGITTGLSDEQTARINADSTLTSAVNSLGTSVSGNTSAIAAESAARIASDTSTSTTLASHTSQINTNTSDIATETSARIAVDNGLLNQINTNSSAIAGNTTGIASNAAQISGINTRFSVDKDAGGYVTGYRIIDQSSAPAAFNLKNLNNNVRVFNAGYLGKYFPPVSVLSFSPPISYNTGWGTAPSNDFHGSLGNDYTQQVNVYATQTVALDGSCFKGVDYNTGGDLNRLGQELTTFKVDYSGKVNKYLSLWYRIKNTPADLDQRWFPVAVTESTLPGSGSYSTARGQAVVQINVTADKIIEFGLCVNNTTDAQIWDSTNAFIYGGSVSVMALNMVTIS